MKRLLFLLLPLHLFSFEIQPWFHEFMQFQLIPSYTFQHYPSIQGAFNPTHYTSNDHILALALGLSFHPEFDAQIETDFSKTHAKDFGWRSAGMQFRYLPLNDVEGDPVSLTLGVQARFVSFDRLSDVSTPFHYVSNFEVGAAVGKEVDHEQFWILRLWGYLGGGIANRGSPWIRAYLALFSNIKCSHRLHFFSEGYFGTGNKNQIDIAKHIGYFNVHHQSVDVGAAYQYHFQRWGELTIEYFYRVYAHAFPKNLQSITLKYRLPFSIF